MTSKPATPSDRYTHGHDAAVLRSHMTRTVDTSARYLIPYLAPGRTLLDVGCGPATLTADLARRVAPGEVVAVDVEAIVATARQTIADRGVDVEVRSGDVYALDLDSDRFDIVHAHQVLQHLSDPVAALREMRRVCRPGGVVAVRDSDYGAFRWWPPEPALDRWLALYHRVTAHNRAEADAGRHLLAWAHAADFSDVTLTSSTWVFATSEERSWWAELWAERASTGSAFGQQAVEYGYADEADLAEMGAGWRRWAAQPDGCLFVPHGEVIAFA
jgi:ubiquinone/menaquinone biosynthesis C-methylase UbiE